ncbi:hypothetical protein BS78_01G154900 [Paspalum vaginatum]|nr:hypothetical protein BS78_01G154900 [Paspalum vaginatum]
MAAAATSSPRSFAAACVLAVLLISCLLAAADARRLYPTAPAMPPTTADDMYRAMAPAPQSGADHAGRMLFQGGRGLLGGGLRLAGRLLLGLGL